MNRINGEVTPSQIVFIITSGEMREKINKIQHNQKMGHTCFTIA